MNAYIYPLIEAHRIENIARKLQRIANNHYRVSIIGSKNGKRSGDRASIDIKHACRIIMHDVYQIRPYTIAKTLDVNNATVINSLKQRNVAEVQKAVMKIKRFLD
jgi:hypothetical protein